MSIMTGETSDGSEGAAPLLARLLNALCELIEANPIRGKYSRPTYLTKNHISKDPSKGFRWDLQYRIHDHEELICYPSREISRQVEAWLHQQLAKLGYVVGGDLGVPLQIQ